MSKTYRNPRRAALAQLKAIRDRLQWCMNRWTVSGTVYESVQKTYVEQHTGIERTYTDSNPRKRRPEEYPENTVADWATLYAQANEAALEANALAEFARREWHKCLEAQQTV
jgi:hypothetical protein